MSDKRTIEWDAEAEAELRRTYERWFRALADGDWEFLEGIMDERWRYTDSVGVVRTKAEYIDLLRRTEVEFSIDLADFDVLRIDDTAIVRAIWITRADHAYGEVCSTTSHTAVWAREEGRWRSFLHHVTTVTDSAIRAPSVRASAAAE